MFLRLLGPLASDLLIDDVFKNHKGGYLESFTYAFAAHLICFSTCRKMIEILGELSGEPFSRGRHCGFFTENIGCNIVHIIPEIVSFIQASSVTSSDIIARLTSQWFAPLNCPLQGTR